jgi:hypothetical protein
MTKKTKWILINKKFYNKEGCLVMESSYDY